MTTVKRKNQDDTSPESIRCRLSDLTTEERQQILDQLRPSDPLLADIFEKLDEPVAYLVEIGLVRCKNSVSFSSISGPPSCLLPIEYRKSLWREWKIGRPAMMAQFEKKYGPIENITEQSLLAYEIGRADKE
jgi:hypothetical protein